MADEEDQPSGPDDAERRPAKDPMRVLMGKIGANTRWAMETNRTAATQPARDGQYRKWEDQVDPDRVLPGPERAKRVESLRRAHFQRMALKSAQVRKAKKKGGGATP